MRINICRIFGGASQILGNCDTCGTGEFGGISPCPPLSVPKIWNRPDFWFDISQKLCYIFLRCLLKPCASMSPQLSGQSVWLRTKRSQVRILPGTPGKQVPGLFFENWFWLIIGSVAILLIKLGRGTSRLSVSTLKALETRPPHETVSEGKTL